MFVETIMTTPVVAILESATVREAARLMVAGRLGGLPVVSQDGALQGMVSEGDFLRRNSLAPERKSPWWLEWFASTGKSAEDYAEIYERTVGEVMSRGVVTIGKDATVDDVAELMAKRLLKRIPVVDQGKVIGIVARVDLLKGLARRMPADYVAVTEDERLQAAVDAALVKSLGKSFVRSRVNAGVAELQGMVFNESTHTAALAAVQDVAGLKSVQDEIVWVEPMAERVVLP